MKTLKDNYSNKKSLFICGLLYYGKLLQYNKIKFTRIHNEGKYSAPIDFINTIKYDVFFNS